MTAPLTPAECDLRDFPRMMLDIGRLRSSEFDTILDDGAWRAGLNLWMSSWHQVPAASLPNDEAGLAKAAGLGRDVKSWRKVRVLALRGWIEADDGLLYHPVVAELALEGWIDKLGQRLSSGAGNAKKHGTEFDAEPLYAEIKVAAGLLAGLNPKSRSLSKQHVHKAVHGLPLGGNKLEPGPPVGSQGKGREGNISRKGASKKAPSPTESARADARRDGASDERSSVEGLTLDEIRARIAEEQGPPAQVVDLSERRQA